MQVMQLSACMNFDMKTQYRKPENEILISNNCSFSCMLSLALKTALPMIFYI